MTVCDNCKAPITNVNFIRAHTYGKYSSLRDPDFCCPKCVAEYFRKLAEKEAGTKCP